MTPWLFVKLSFKFFYNFLLIDFAINLIVLNLLTYEQIYYQRVCKSRKNIQKCPYKLPDTISYNTETFAEAMINIMVE